MDLYEPVCGLGRTEGVRAEGNSGRSDEASLPYSIFPGLADSIPYLPTFPDTQDEDIEPS